jgi:type II secretory pathway component GspD/PulD (secretin)
LASPNISVLDGERAFILIGDRINFPVLVGYSDGGNPIFSKEEERVGIYLQVAASVASDGGITMSLYPQVSTVTGFLEINGASYPQISTREAQSTLRIRSGETLVMGGLLKTEEVRQMEKVPILGDIPFIGELFRRRKTSKNSSQVLISIKPTVIRGEEGR